MRLPVEKSKFFRALRLDFSKERDKLLIEIAAQNELIQLKQEKKQSQNPMGTAAQLIPNSNIPNYLSKKNKPEQSRKTPGNRFRHGIFCGT